MKTRRFKVWCDSGANAQSCRKEVVTLEGVGFSEEEWEKLTEEEKESLMKEIAFENLDWGWIELEDGEDED